MNAVATQIEISEDRIIERCDLSFSEQIALIVEHMKGMEQTECPVTHRFAPGVYLREIEMPADTIVIGKIHKTKHFNLLVRGSCLIVHGDGSREELHAPFVFVSEAGVQKVLYITEDMVWQTIHPTNETDLVLLEEELITKESPFLSDEIRAECARIAEERAQRALL